MKRTTRACFLLLPVVAIGAWLGHREYRKARWRAEVEVAVNTAYLQMDGKTIPLDRRKGREELVASVVKFLGPVMEKKGKEIAYIDFDGKKKGVGAFVLGRFDVNTYTRESFPEDRRDKWVPALIMEIGPHLIRDSSGRFLFGSDAPSLFPRHEGTFASARECAEWLVDRCLGAWDRAASRPANW